MTANIDASPAAAPDPALFFPPITPQSTTPEQQHRQTERLLERLREQLGPAGRVQVGFANALWNTAQFDGVILLGNALHRLQIHLAQDGSSSVRTVRMTHTSDLRPYVRIPDIRTGELVAMPFRARVHGHTPEDLHVQPDYHGRVTFYPLGQDARPDWTREHHMQPPGYGHRPIPEMRVPVWHLWLTLGLVIGVLMLVLR